MTRFALLADIHGNSPALSAVLKDVAQMGCECMYVLGDIINGHDPAGCVELLQSWPGTVAALKGNAEAYLLTPDLDNFPMRQEPMYVSLIRLLRWYEVKLTPAHMAWLSNLPEIIRWNGACLAHDSPIDRLFTEHHSTPGIDTKYHELMYHSPGINSDIASDRLTQLLTWMEKETVSQVYVGHTHVPFIRWHSSRLLCNVGSVGLPLDGDPRAAWVMVEQMNGKIPMVEIRRVEYEIPAILHIIDSNYDAPDFERPGMQQAYKKMIQTGIHWRAHLNEVIP